MTYGARAMPARLEPGLRRCSSHDHDEVGLFDDTVDAHRTVAAADSILADPHPSVLVHDARSEGFDVHTIVCGHFYPHISPQRSHAASTERRTSCIHSAPEFR